MKNGVERKLDECYNHIKYYLDEKEELHEMCKSCEFYCGKEHNYEECRNKQCFLNWLAYAYLEWIES